MIRLQKDTYGRGFNLESDITVVEQANKTTLTLSETETQKEWLIHFMNISSMSQIAGVNCGVSTKYWTSNEPTKSFREWSLCVKRADQKKLFCFRWAWASIVTSSIQHVMMTPSNGNIFRITGHLCREFTGHRWIPPQRPVTRSFGVFFGLHLNKRLSKQKWGWWFETPSRPLWRYCNAKRRSSSRNIPGR